MTVIDEICKEEIALTVIRILNVEPPSFYTFPPDDDIQWSEHVAL